MNYDLPTPPLLKATIIQLNKDLDQETGNFEILTNDYSNKESGEPSTSPVMAANIAKKKRRRSNSNVNDEELAKRRIETKQLHSIIEKRRRIKINREFEALKYLIPACRTTKNNDKTSNNSKIDGMYKLTILKSSVEYIMYLHHLIQKQLDVIQGFDPEFNFDLNFTKYPLNVNEYRNIDKEFSFKKLVESIDKELGSTEEAEEEEDYEYDDDSFQLPSPIVTPDMPPSRFKYNSKFQLPDPALSLPRKKLFKSPPKDHVINEDPEGETASKTLLSLRKSSIDSLLN